MTTPTTWEAFTLEHVLNVRDTLRQKASSDASANQQLGALENIIKDSALAVLEAHANGLSQFGNVQQYNDAAVKEVIDGVRNTERFAKNPLLKDAFGISDADQVATPTPEDPASKRRLTNVPGFNSFKQKMEAELQLQLKQKMELQPAPAARNWPPQPAKP